MIMKQRNSAEKILESGRTVKRETPPPDLFLRISRKIEYETYGVTLPLPRVTLAYGLLILLLLLNIFVLIEYNSADGQITQQQHAHRYSEMTLSSFTSY